MHIQLRPARKSLDRVLTEGMPVGSVHRCPPMQETRRRQPCPVSRSSCSVRGHYGCDRGYESLHDTSSLRGLERACEVVSPGMHVFRKVGP